MPGVRARTLRMESIPDLPPLPRRRITLPLSTLAEVTRDVCDGYDPPAKRRAYAKAHPLWRELPAHLHALMNALTSVCRGRPGALTLTSSASLGRLIGRSAKSWLGLSEQFFRLDRWNLCRVQAAAICGSRVK